MRLLIYLLIIVLCGLTLLFASPSVRAQIPGLNCPGQWVPYGGGYSCRCPDGSLANYVGGQVVCPTPRYRRSPAQAACETGYYRSGSRCVKKGHKACPDGKHTCPKEMQCISGGCAPQDASACPSGQGHYCKAPLTCAVGVDGEESCFTTDGLRELKIEKDRHQREIRTALRAERDRLARERFEQQYGKPYDVWLEYVRGLVAKLHELPAGETGNANSVKQELDTAFTPQPLPVGTPNDGANEPTVSQEGKEQCKKVFDLSDLWDEGFRFIRCADRGWAIARKVTPERDLPNCVALNENGKLFFEVGRSDKQTSDGNAFLTKYARIGFTNLQPNAWLLEEGDRADVRVNVDRGIVYDKVEKVGISKTPPLRYSFDWRTTPSDLQAFVKGQEAVAQIADKTWTVSLRGSARAIKETERCVKATE